MNIGQKITNFLCCAPKNSAVVDDDQSSNSTPPPRVANETGASMGSPARSQRTQQLEPVSSQQTPDPTSTLQQPSKPLINKDDLVRNFIDLLRTMA